MKNVIIFISLLITSCLSGQILRIDKDFGSNGKLKLKSGYVKKIFYESGDSSFYLTYKDSSYDNFSYGYEYFEDGVYKLDIRTGEYDQNFGKKGHSKHVKNSKEKTYSGRYWYFSEDAILCINYDAADIDFLIFDRANGDLSLFPRPESHHGNFIYFDKNNNRILLSGPTELMWCDAEGRLEYLEIEGYSGQNAESVSIELIDSSPDSLVFLIQEYNPDLDSLQFNYKITSLAGYESRLLHSFKSEYLYLNKWDHSRSALIMKSESYFTFHLDLLHTGSERSQIAMPVDSQASLKFIDEADSVIYAIKRTRFNERWDLVQNRITSYDEKKDTIVTIDLTSNEILEYSLKGVISSNMHISQIKHIGNREFIILAYERKRRKIKYFLYKVFID